MKSEILNSLLLKMKNHRRKGKLIAILALVLVMGTASAQVFTMYYGHSTATVRAADVTLVAGTDASLVVPPSKYPAATVEVSSTADYATVGISMFASESNLPQPATYFTDVLQIQNAAGAQTHTIKQILISNIDNTDSALGQITVYYCTSDDLTGVVDHFDITDTTGGNLLAIAGEQTIVGGSMAYIAIVAYAADTANADDSVAFDIAIQWV